MESGEFVNVSREKASKDESRIIHREATWTTMDPDLVVVRYDFTECSYENSFIPNYDELAGLNDPAGLITNPIIFCCLFSIKILAKKCFFFKHQVKVCINCFSVPLRFEVTFSVARDSSRYLQPSLVKCTPKMCCWNWALQ